MESYRIVVSWKWFNWQCKTLIYKNKWNMMQNFKNRTSVQKCAQNAWSNVLSSFGIVSWRYASRTPDCMVTSDIHVYIIFFFFFWKCMTMYMHLKKNRYPFLMNIYIKVVFNCKIHWQGFDLIIITTEMMMFPICHLSVIIWIIVKKIFTSLSCFIPSSIRYIKNTNIVA